MSSSNSSPRRDLDRGKGKVNRSSMKRKSKTNFFNNGVVINETRLIIANDSSSKNESTYVWRNSDNVSPPSSSCRSSHPTLSAGSPFVVTLFPSFSSSISLPLCATMLHTLSKEGEEQVHVYGLGRVGCEGKGMKYF